MAERTVGFKFEAKTNAFSGKLRRIGGDVSGLAKSFAAVTTAAGGALSVGRSAFSGLSAAIEKTVGAAAEFERVNNAIQANLGEADMAKLSNGFRQIGIESKFTIAQIQGAALELARLGASEKDLLPLIRASAKAAAITGTDLVQSAKIGKSLMNSLGLEAKDTSKLMTAMVQASTSSAADIASLGEAFKNVGATAGLFKAKLEDILPAIQLMRDRNIAASTAGIALRNMTTSLLNPTAKSAKLLEKLGLMSGETGELIESINPKTASTIQMFEALRASGINVAQMSQVFGKEFGPVLAALALGETKGKSTVAVMKMMRTQLLNQGAAAKKAAVMQQGLAVELEQIKSTFDSASLKVGELVSNVLKIGPTFKTIRTAIGGAVEQLNKLTPEQFKEIGLRVFSAESLTSAFSVAVNQALPALGTGLIKAVSTSFFFGARTFLKFAPMMAAGFGKNAVSLVGSGMIQIAKVAGVTMSSIIAATLQAGINGLVSVMAPLIAKLSTAMADKLREGAAGLSRSIAAARETNVENIRKGGGELDRLFQQHVVARITIDPKAMMKGGEALADGLGLSTLTDLKESFRNIGTTLQRAGEQLAKRDAALAEKRRKQALEKRLAPLRLKREREAADVVRVQSKISTAEARRAAMAKAMPEQRQRLEEARRAVANAPGPALKKTLGMAVDIEKAQLDKQAADIKALTESVKQLTAQLQKEQRDVAAVDKSINHITAYGIAKPEDITNARRRRKPAVGGGTSSGREAR